MKAKEYIAKLTKALSSRNDVVWKVYPLRYKAWVFQLLRIQSKDISPDDKVIMITAWIHGNETSGPFFILSYIQQILALMNMYGYKVIIYPLMNPSGFEYGTRFNIDNDEWSYGNNDFVRYQMTDGTFADECREGETFTKRYRSSDPQLQQKLPVETALLHKLLREDILHHIVAHIDLHQDYITPIEWSYTYFYTFSDTYQSIIANIRKYIAVLSDTMISAGQTWGAQSNANACIIRHDGTINDLLYRLGIHDTIAIETTGQTPLALAKKINRLWIKWLVLFLNNDRLCWPKRPSSSKKNEKKRK